MFIRCCCCSSFFFFFPSGGLGMAEPIELKFSLNTLPYPGFKVRDGEVDPFRRLPAVPRKRSGNTDFRRFPPMLNRWVDISLCFTQNKHYAPWKQTLSPTLSYIHSSLVPRIRPVFRVRSPNPFLTIFAIFSVKSSRNRMVTPPQLWPTTHDSAVLPIRPIFRVDRQTRF